VWQTLTHVLRYIYTHICTYSDMYVCMYVCMPVCMYARMYDVSVNVGHAFPNPRCVCMEWHCANAPSQCKHTYHCARVEMHIKYCVQGVCYCTWIYAVPFGQVSCYHNKQHMHRVMSLVPAVHNQQQVYSTKQHMLHGRHSCS
jgi:hypothetical protein